LSEGGGGREGKNVIPMSEALRAADKNHIWWITFTPKLSDGMRKAMIDMKQGTLLETFFFQKETKFFLFHNFNTGSHGATFNHIFETFFDTVVLLPASNGSKKHQKTPRHSKFILILVQKKILLENFSIFGQNYLFDLVIRF
jgi:hypothetical protein